MGMFDTVWFQNKKGEDVGVQIKMLDCVLHEYEIGEPIDLSNGIYFDHDSCFVVFKGLIVAGFDGEDMPLRTKRNRPIKMPDLNEY